MFKVKHMPAALFSAGEPARCAPRPRSPLAPPVRALPEGQRCFQPGKRRAERLWEREKGEDDKNPEQTKPRFSVVARCETSSLWRGGGQAGAARSWSGRGDCASPGAVRCEREREAHCVCPPSLHGAEIPRKALGSGFDSLETLVIVMLTVKNLSVNP